MNRPFRNGYFINLCGTGTLFDSSNVLCDNSVKNVFEVIVAFQILAKTFVPRIKTGQPKKGNAGETDSALKFGGRQCTSIAE